jgi:hypothetical protein
MEYKDPISKIKPNKGMDNKRTRNNFNTPLQLKTTSTRSHLEETQMATIAYGQQNLEKIFDKSDFSQSMRSESEGGVDFYGNKDAFE